MFEEKHKNPVTVNVKCKICGCETVLEQAESSVCVYAVCAVCRYPTESYALATKTEQEILEEYV